MGSAMVWGAANVAARAMLCDRLKRASQCPGAQPSPGPPATSAPAGPASAAASASFCMTATWRSARADKKMMLVWSFSCKPWQTQARLVARLAPRQPPWWTVRPSSVPTWYLMHSFNLPTFWFSTMALISSSFSSKYRCGQGRHVVGTQARDGPRLPRQTGTAVDHKPARRPW